MGAGLVPIACPVRLVSQQLVGAMTTTSEPLMNIFLIDTSNFTHNTKNKASFAHITVSNNVFATPCQHSIWLSSSFAQMPWTLHQMKKWHHHLPPLHNCRKETHQLLLWTSSCCGDFPQHVAKGASAGNMQLKIVTPLVTMTGNCLSNSEDAQFHGPH